MDLSKLLSARHFFHSLELGDIGAINTILGSELWPNAKLSFMSWFRSKDPTRTFCQGKFVGTKSGNFEILTNCWTLGSLHVSDIGKGNHFFLKPSFSNPRCWNQARNMKMPGKLPAPRDKPWKLPHFSDKSSKLVVLTCSLFLPPVVDHLEAILENNP